MGPHLRLIAVTHMSNVTGTVVDIGAIARGACAGAGRWQPGLGASAGRPERAWRRFLLHHRTQALRPLGVGGDLDRADRQAEMRPFMGGGDMIRTVTLDEVTYADPPLGIRAGTPGIVNQIGWAWHWNT